MPIQPRRPIARLKSRLKSLFENPIRCWCSFRNSRTSPRMTSASGGSSTGSKRNIGVAMVVSLPVRVKAGEGGGNAMDLGQQLFLQAHRSVQREVKIDRIRQPTKSVANCLCQTIIGATGGKDTHRI